MKKVLLILMSSVLIFGCNKNEAEKVVENKELDSKEKKIEQVASKSTEIVEDEKVVIKGLNPEINTITVGNDELGFVYTEDLSKDELDNNCPPAPYPNFKLKMEIIKFKVGEGMMDSSDSSFKDMEDAVFENKKIPAHDFSSNSKLINIDGYKFVQDIIIARYEAASRFLDINLRTTTPKSKYIITFRLDTDDVLDAMLKEAPMYFHDSGMTSDTEIDGWGNKVPAWNCGANDVPDYNMKSFCKKLIEGKCESKTAQEVFNKYQELIKTMKIN